MTRTYFRNISVMVVAALVLLAVVQSMWVVKLYRDTCDDFIRRVHNATYKSVYKSFRMDAIPGFQPADMVKIDLDDFTFWFEPSLLELDALQPYAIEIINRHLDDMVMMYRGDKEQLHRARSFDFDIDDNAMFALRLYIEIPYLDFVKQMWGLILSSVAIVVVVTAVFVYLIRVMFRQKSLEEMRRDLTHNITHELKTPISVAYAANDALRNFSAVEDVQKRNRYLEIVALQLSRLSTMVERILAVSVEEGDVVRVTEADDSVCISIADNGKGIAARHVEHIFDKFYRVPSGDRHDVRGYGLGLYYARCVVKRHGGEIAASSREGKGTTITIKLPRNGA